MAKLKIRGTWTGVLEIELEEWTLPMLRGEVAKRSNVDPESINLICAGKVLKDGDATQKLSQLGIQNNAKILAVRVSDGMDEFLKFKWTPEQERAIGLVRLKLAATVLSQKHSGGLLRAEDFSLEIKSRGGERVDLASETDQKAIMLGLIFHANARKLIKKEMHKDALKMLGLGEEAFSLCNSKIIELLDNVPILQIDMVWCHYLVGDNKWLSAAGVRLEKAREGIERCYGKELSRIRLLQAGHQPELALHGRLELLEGIVAYHNGQFDKSSKALISAHAKFLQLRVPREALHGVICKGFNESDARRALRLNNHDVRIAIDFLVEETANREQKREDNSLHRIEIMVEKDLAAEALRRNENELTNPETSLVIQIDIQSRKRSRQQRAGKSGNVDEVEGNLSDSDAVGGTSTAGERDDEDAAMEGGIAMEVGDLDALSDYDTEHRREALAIYQYLYRLIW